MFVLLLAVLVGLLSNINAVPTVVSDYRIQDPNLTPALGRGYSLTTNQVLSTCLQFKEKTEPTYNYDYDYLDIKHDGKTDEKKSGKFQASLSWGFVSASVTGSFSSESHEEVHTHNIVTRMAMERYYSSVDDTTSSLTKDAVDLIKKGDLLGFYQACGSGYIRSIRRVAEVAAVFTYESKSLDSVTKAAASLQIKLFGRGAGGGSFEMESTSHSSDTKLKIQIKAFGLGLNGNGSQTLVATSLEDYQGAIQYAFKSMQNDDVGMVRGIEVLPWVDSLQFQNQVEFTDLEVVGTEPSANQVVPADYKPKIVSSVEVKAISTINAEFISSIEATYRAQLYYIATMTKCVGDLELMKRNPANTGKFLVDHSKMDFMPSKNKFTVADVSAVINVDKLKEKYNSVVRFVNGFYGPCATAIMQASNRGRMTKYFWEFTNECKPECLLPNYNIDVTVDATSGAKTISCTAPTAIADASKAQVGDYSVDEVIHRFCMPEFDYDIRNPIQ